MFEGIEAIIKLGPFALFAITAIGLIYTVKRSDRCDLYTRELVSSFQKQSDEQFDKFLDFEEKRDEKWLEATRRQTELFSKQNEILIKLEDRIS